MNNLREVISQERRRRNLTPRQKLFIHNLILDPTSLAKAAERAGYSPRTARQTASRLIKDPVIQSELARHFMDKEIVIADILNSTLQKLKEVINGEDVGKALKAAKLAIEYTKVANNILGLDMKTRQKQGNAEMDDLSPDELIQIHANEIARLRRLQDDNDSRTADAESEAGTGAVQ